MDATYQVSGGLNRRNSTNRTRKQGNPSQSIGILRLFTPFWANNRG